MAKQIQLRRGTTVETNDFIGALGEVTVDTDKDVLVVHDGVTGGGFPNAARANADGTISLIKKDGTSVESINAVGLFNNTLTSTNTDQALTAAQGKVLKDLTDLKLGTTSAFGVGQTYQDVTATRVVGTNYTNSTTKPILVLITAGSSVGTSYNAYVNGSLVTGVLNNAQYVSAMSFAFVVQAGVNYKVVGGAVTRWVELR